jgi:TPR repeat protein
MPRLKITNNRGPVGEPIQLGVALREPVAGAALAVGGLVAGTTLSMGKPLGADGWYVPVSDLGSTWVLPPPGFSGPMALVVDLRLADNTVADREVVHLEWTAAAAPAAAPRVAAVSAAPAAPVAAPPATAAHAEAPASAVEPAPRQIDADEVALLVKRGEELVEVGDIAGARVLLKRAAEARDARAALALAATYDPNVLKKLRVFGFAPDVATARIWYQKAKEFGSPEATKRLETLASQAR